MQLPAPSTFLNPPISQLAAGTQTSYLDDRQQTRYQSFISASLRACSAGQIRLIVKAAVSLFSSRYPTLRSCALVCASSFDPWTGLSVNVVYRRWVTSLTWPRCLQRQHAASVKHERLETHSLTVREVWNARYETTPTLRCVSYV